MRLGVSVMSCDVSTEYTYVLTYREERHKGTCTLRRDMGLFCLNACMTTLCKARKAGGVMGLMACQE